MGEGEMGKAGRRRKRVGNSLKHFFLIYEAGNKYISTDDKDRA